MKINRLHDWDVGYQEARSIQWELAKKLSFEFPGLEVKTIAGADISYCKDEPRVYAAVVLLKIPEFEVTERVSFCSDVTVPYIPGLLSFREAPHLAEAFRKLSQKPDVAMFDGHGRAHPRGLGLASHMGLILDIPTIGCAKKILVGTFDPVGEEKGSVSFIEFSGQRVGAVLRSRKKVKPIFVSPGHKISLEKSIEIVLKSLRGYRIPEPIRFAHIFVNRMRKSAGLIS